MVTSQPQVKHPDESRRKIIIISAVIAAVVIAFLFYFLLRATSGDTVQPVLEGAIRAGSPEFEQHRSKIVLDDPDAHEAKRGIGDIWMSLETTARNFTGRTINGLEVRGAVIDHQGKAVKERTVIVVPGGAVRELGPNDTMRVQVTLDGMTDNDDRANIRMDVVGFKFKQ